MEDTPRSRRKPSTAPVRPLASRMWGRFLQLRARGEVQCVPNTSGAAVRRGNEETLACLNSSVVREVALQGLQGRRLSSRARWPEKSTVSYTGNCKRPVVTRPQNTCPRAAGRRGQQNPHRKLSCTNSTCGHLAATLSAVAEHTASNAGCATARAALSWSMPTNVATSCRFLRAMLLYQNTITGLRTRVTRSPPKRSSVWVNERCRSAGKVVEGSMRGLHCNLQLTLERRTGCSCSSAFECPAAPSVQSTTVCMNGQLGDGCVPAEQYLESQMRLAGRDRGRHS